jgi:homeobox protein cut-like
VPVSNNSSTSSSASSNNNNHPTNGLPQDLSLPKSAGRSDSSEEGSERPDKDSRSKFHAKSSENGEANKTPDVVIKTERPELSSSVYMSHSLQNILRPSSTPSPDESPAPASGTGSGGSGGVASPLQRIASITNSLMSQPSNPTLPQVTQRPMKAILPPITQQQFDTYQNLNTEDIVKKVSQSLRTSPPPFNPLRPPHPIAGPYILVNPPPTRPHSSFPQCNRFTDSRPLPGRSYTKTSM